MNMYKIFAGVLFVMPVLPVEAGVLQKWIVAQSTTKDEGGLDLDNPEIDLKKKEEVLNIGPFGDLNIGGALDMRLYFPRPKGPTDMHMGFGNLDIHVAELFVTTNIGDHVSILAEQLLVTSPMGSTVGQDHGFVYAIFSGFPGIFSNLALKVGRSRFRFGIDAKSDSPANVLRSPVYKTLGTITDRGLELSGYTGPVEWSVSVANGVDAVKVPLEPAAGTTLQPGSDEPHMWADIRNGSKPVYLRIGIEALDGLSFGASGFTGKTYPVYSHYGFAMHDMVFNGHTDDTRLIYKNRAALDAKYRMGRWDFGLEFAFGNDRDQGQNYEVRSYYGRVDYRIIPQKLSAHFQYDYFDDGRALVITEGLPYEDSGTFGVGLTYNLTEQSLLRAAWLQDDRSLFRSKFQGGPEYLGVVQSLLAF
jgi:hypothetical protein